MTKPLHVNEPVPRYGQMPPDADADLKGSLTAIRRAALRARLVAQQTGTDLIVVREGQVVRVSPQQKTTP
jgi:hypothetical protein